MQNYFSEHARKGIVVTLDSGESQHISRVMRMSEGDKLQICNGKGCVFDAKILQVSKKGVEVSIGNSIEENLNPESLLHIGIAPTKNIGRFEWFLEKVTEIGVAQISPFLSDNSERKVIKTERLEKIIVSAMKQSRHLYKPIFNSLMPLKELIDNCDAEQKFIAYCEDLPDVQLVRKINPLKSAMVLIGPEGDFSDAEINYAMNSGFIPVAIGNFRLRTETAGIVTAQIVQDVSIASF